MILGTILNDSFGLLSRQLRFYCWHYRRNLDHKQKQELIDILNEQHFERLACKIKALYQSNMADCKQQITKLLFEQCLSGHRRHQLIQLIESGLVDIDVRLDNYGRTLLHRMAYILDVELVKLLIDHGVNIRLRDYAGNTALHIAIQSYRNGSLIYNNNEFNIVENLKTIIRLLLVADKQLVDERVNRKRIKLDESNRSQELNRHETILKTEVNKFTDESQTNNKSSDSIQSQSYRKSSQQPSKESIKQIEPSNRSYEVAKHEAFKDEKRTNQLVQSSECSSCPMKPLLMEDSTSSLIDTKNAFGRTALHYCVLVVGEQHVSDFVNLLISFGADTDAIDTRLKTPLYCLVKRPGISAIRQICISIRLLLKSGCDDLGLAIDPEVHLTDDLIAKLEKDTPRLMQTRSNNQTDPVLNQSTFKRVPSLMHLARLAIMRMDADKYAKICPQLSYVLPNGIPGCLNQYLKRKILSQTELF